MQETEEAQQVPFPEQGDQNIVKDAQRQRQVQMIQKMPSEIHSNDPEHADAWFQRSSNAIARFSTSDLEQTTDELEKKGA